MENKIPTQAFKLQRGQRTQKPPELSISQQPDVDFYTKIGAILRHLNNWFSPLQNLKSLNVSQFPEHPGGSWGSEVSPTIREKEFQDHLMKLNSQKFMGPDDMHPRILKKLADFVAKLLSVKLEKACQ